MTSLKGFSWRQVDKALHKAGFTDWKSHSKGSHSAYVKTENGISRLVIVPRKKDIPVGKMHAIAKQAGISPSEFQKLLR